MQWVEQGHTAKQAFLEYGVSETTIKTWRKMVRLQDSHSLASKERNQSYSASFKLSAVNAYLNKEGSQEDLALKYGLRSKTQLRRWILKYNQGEAIKSSRGGASRTMSIGRKTNYEERLEIVRHCKANDSNYQETAELYQVSYQQVYSWVRKYDAGGEKALLDRRGQSKDKAALTEMDHLKLENRKLQKQNRELEVENALLKKLEELERRHR